MLHDINSFAIISMCVCVCVCVCIYMYIYIYIYIYNLWYVCVSAHHA